MATFQDAVDIVCPEAVKLQYYPRENCKYLNVDGTTYFRVLPRLDNKRPGK